MKKQISLFLIFSIVTSLFLNTVPVLQSKVSAESETNLIANPSFEQTVANPSWENNLGPLGWSVWFARPGGVVSLDTEVYHSGRYSAKIVQDVECRTDVSVSGGIDVVPERSYKLGIWIKTQDVPYNGVYFRTYYYDAVTNRKIANGPYKKISGTRDWTNIELYATVPYNANNFKFEVMFETGTGIVWIDDAYMALFNGLIDVKLDNTFVKLNIGDEIQLNPIFIPSNAIDKSVIWTSSNPSVVEVDNVGKVKAKDYGDATVRVSTPDGRAYAECVISVESEVNEGIMEQLRLKWYDRLTGNNIYDANDADMVAAVENITNKVTNDDKTGSWDTLNKSEGRAHLWENYNRPNRSYDINMCYSFLRDMALAYSCVGSTLYQNQQLKDDIISALDWLYDNKYNERIIPYDNWWDWEIGIPKILGDIMTLMYNDLSPDQLGKYIKAIDRFVPDPTTSSMRHVHETGANLLDKALAVVIRGIVGKASYKIKQGSECIGSEYEYTTSGDGVYEDGSLVQHFYIAYTGAYGSTWLNDTEQMMYVLKETPWAITDSRVNNVFNWVSNTYEPVIYKGLMMDMVNGRNISRGVPGGITGSAKGTILCIMRLAQSAPIDKAMAMKQMVKEWVEKDTTVANYYQGMSLHDISLLKSIMNDPSIMPRGELIKDQVFAGMDRVVHLRDGYGFGISMFSKRISAFEYGNGENKNGWYTGMGMTYLYNDDLLQYRVDYWPTVDSYRLAGTTTDGSYKTPIAWAPYYNPQDWVGGVSLDNLGCAVGMDFSLKESTGSSLHGKKSWFCFDDEIIALGSGISGGDGRNVETIIDNRQIKDSGDNILTIDGHIKSSELGWHETMSDIKWAHLTGNMPNTDIGYYFPDSTCDIYGLREARTGSWYDINSSRSKDPVTKNYVSLAFEHGVNPTDSSYSYVILPNKSVKETEKYAKRPSIRILSNTNDVHAVQQTDLCITAANFWVAGNVENITVDSPCAVMLREQGKSKDKWEDKDNKKSKGDEIVLSVSDPTRLQKQIIIEIGKDGYELASKDDTVDVLQVSPTIKVAVNVDGTIGRTQTVKFVKAKSCK